MSQPTQSATLETARRAIRQERDGLTALGEALDMRFVHAVDALDTVRKNGGRVVVTGMGKSGHIGRKIAATLASTGTPALFVHPGEASHGDLGMITERDAVIALSNSGEAPELADTIHYTRRFGIPLVGITSRGDSTLAQHADHVLILPAVAEACPNGLAPTTSTTMSLALGDAIAIALLDRLGLTAQQFKVFHPGGKIGQKLRPVRELMDQLGQVPLVGTGTTMDKAILVMTSYNMGCVVVEGPDHTLLGLITDGDLKRHMTPDLLGRTVDSIMTTNPQSIGPEALAAEAVDRMLNSFKQPISCLTVTEEGRLVGLIRLQACVQAGVV